MVGISFSICCFIFLTIISIFYFSKERIKNLDNKIFTILLLTNLIGIIIDILGFLSFRILGAKNPLNVCISKIYLVYFVTYAYCLMIYIYNFTFGIKKKIKKFILVFIFVCFTILILPIKVYFDGIVGYSYGISIDFAYGVGFLIILVMLFCLCKSIKNIHREFIPLLAFILLIFLTIIIQSINPELTLLPFANSIVTTLMYFTIENPDMKLIKELNIAKDQSEKANQAKSEFLSNMSHEIRTPLNAIVGFSQALLEEDIPKQARDEVEDIVLASNNLLEIINGILDISKIESGKIEIINTEYHFQDIFDELVVLARGRLGDKSLDFRIHYDESIPNTLYGDYIRIKQVILNILTNAIKYTKEGYIDFNVSSVVKDDICRIIVSVEDSGIGIKQDKIPLLFEKFERVDAEKNITIEGTGLGLAITKKLIELMGGSIVVQSVYGKGSKFTIALDQRIIKKKEVAKLENHDDLVSVDSISVSGKKVLIVDDNQINLKVATRLLQGYQLVITSCNSGFEAIDHIKNDEEFDLILMDDMMPKMSGVETLNQLKEIDGFNIPVVALTANAISGMREKYISDGFDDYLAKPIDKEELAKIVAKYLN